MYFFLKMSILTVHLRMDWYISLMLLCVIHSATECRRRQVCHLLDIPIAEALVEKRAEQVDLVREHGIALSEFI